MQSADALRGIWGAQAASLLLSAACRDASVYTKCCRQAAGWQPALPRKESARREASHFERDAFGETRSRPKILWDTTERVPPIS